MNNLETLINELCPEGVKFITISSLCKRNKGIPITAAKMKELNKEDGSIRIFAAGNTKADVDINDIDSKSVITTPSVIVKSRGNIGFEYYDKPFSHKTEMWSYTSIDENHLHIKFLYYYLSSLTTKFQTKARANSVKLPQLSIGDTDKFEIPLPPIEVQTEIVRILDKFTELEAELDCRKRQYEYYRDKLLSFENVGGQNVEWKKMSEICLSICSGGTPLTSKPEYYDGDIPWLRTQEVDYCEINSTLRNITQLGLDNSSAKMIPSNCVIVAMYGATAAKVAINKIPLCTNQACCNLQIDESKAKVRYVYQWLCKQYDVLKALGEGSQHNINAKKVKDFAIPIPPLAEQERIVSVLDRFESLTTSLTAGLPAEIAARRQQYEHYRDKLLTFKRKSA